MSAKLHKTSGFGKLLLPDLALFYFLIRHFFYAAKVHRKEMRIFFLRHLETAPSGDGMDCLSDEQFNTKFFFFCYPQKS
ncbi:MAG: hypothetical protein LBK96_01855 [Prevotellaceae bacterium]|nr:hypothetical protein [Prevotellaceae bacterium]